MSEIRKCNERYFDGEFCPQCGSDGTIVIDENQRRTLSKFISGLLRHFPQDYNLDIDNRGWVDADSIIDICEDKYNWFCEDMIYAVIETDKKGRFEYDNQSVRAVYGHSVDHINIEDNNKNIPEILYHGTDICNFRSIIDEGLKPMSRNKVHLTNSIEEAKKVGHRHSSEVVVLEIDAKKMKQNGLNITKRSSVIYTCDTVPPEFISER